MSIHPEKQAEIDAGRFDDLTIETVEEGPESYSVMTDRRTGFAIRKKWGREPKVGDQVRLFTHGGSSVHGIDLNGAELFYHDKAKQDAVHAEWVTLLTEKEMEAILTDCEAGTIPPVPELAQVPVIADEAIRADERITFHAGSHRTAVRVDRAAWEQRIDGLSAQGLRVLASARTGPEGNIGDGKVFVLPAEDAIDISGAARGPEAV